MDRTESAEQEWRGYLDAAYKLGREAGENAAAWWEQDAIGGRSGGTLEDDRETARRVLVGIEAGDPEILDSLPWPDLSGQWADDPTPATVLDDLGVDAEDDGADDLLTEWENGARDGVIDVVWQFCRARCACSWPAAARRSLSGTRRSGSSPTRR